MLSYCLRCREKTDSKNLKLVKKNKEKRKILSTCAVCNVKNWDLSKNKKLVGYYVGQEKRHLLVKFL